MEPEDRWMFEPKRFVRVRYTDNKERRVLYGYCPLRDDSERAIRDSLNCALKQGGNIVVEEAVIVRMCCNSTKDDLIVEEVDGAA